jgi:hypothetical protein
MCIGVIRYAFGRLSMFISAPNLNTHRQPESRAWRPQTQPDPRAERALPWNKKDADFLIPKKQSSRPFLSMTNAANGGGAA